MREQTKEATKMKNRFFAFFAQNGKNIQVILTENLSFKN
jgi:hypothetical protein